MFIGPHAATFNLLRRHMKTFMGACDHKQRLELDSRDLQLTARWNELAADSARDHVPYLSTLGEVVSFPALFEAYPNLPQLPLRMLRRPDEESAIALVTDKLSTIIHTPMHGTAHEQRGWIAHEIQHVVQAIEGYSIGSSLESEFLKLAKDMQTQLRSPHSHLAAGQPDPLTFKLHDKHRDTLIAFNQKLIRNPERYSKKSSLRERHHPACRAYQAFLQRAALLNYYDRPGEVEAYATMARLDWTMDKRSQHLPPHAYSRACAIRATGIPFGVNFEPRPNNPHEDELITQLQLRAAPQEPPAVTRRSIWQRLFGPI